MAAGGGIGDVEPDIGMTCSPDVECSPHRLGQAVMTSPNRLQTLFVENHGERLAHAEDAGARDEDGGHADDINLGGSKVKKDRRTRLREKLLDRLAKNKGMYCCCFVTLADEFVSSVSDGHAFQWPQRERPQLRMEDLG